MIFWGHVKAEQLQDPGSHKFNRCKLSILNLFRTIFKSLWSGIDSCWQLAPLDSSVAANSQSLTWKGNQEIKRCKKKE
jgi:hypothetical protein